MKSGFRLRRSDIEKSFNELIDNTWKEKTSNILFLIGKGGNGKTTLIKNFHEDIAKDRRVRRLKILDLRNVNLYGVGTLVNQIWLDLTRQDKDQVFFDLQSFKKIEIINKELKKSSEVVVFFFDTFESLSNQERHTLVVDCLGEFENTVTVIAGRPTGDLNELMRNRDHTSFDIQGFDEVQSYSYMSSIKLELDNNNKAKLVNLCRYEDEHADKNNISPLYLNLASNILSDSEKNKSLMRSIATSPVSQNINFINTILEKYCDHSFDLPIWMAVIKYPVTKDLFSKIFLHLKDTSSKGLLSIDQKDPENNSHFWDTISEADWIRSDTNSNEIGITLHDQISADLNFSGLIDKYFIDDSDYFKDRYLRIMSLFCKSEISDNNSSKLISDTCDIVFNPEKSVKVILSEIKENKSSVSKLRLDNIVSLLTVKRGQDNTIFDRLGITDDILCCFLSDRICVKEFFQVLCLYSTSSDTSFDVLDDFYLKFMEADVLSPEDKFTMLVGLTNVAIKGRLANDKIEQRLLSRVQLSDHKNDKLRSYNVIEQYYQYSLKTYDSEKTKIKSISLILDSLLFDSSESPSVKSIASTFNNIASDVIKGPHAHDALYIINIVTDLYNYDDTTSQHIFMSHLLQKVNIYSGLHNFSVAKKLLNDVKSNESGLSDTILAIREADINTMGVLEGEFQLNNDQIVEKLLGIEANIDMLGETEISKLFSGLGKYYLDFSLNDYENSTDSLYKALSYFKKALHSSRVLNSIGLEVQYLLDCSTVALLLLAQDESFNFNNIVNDINALASEDSTVNIDINLHPQVMLHKAHWLLLLNKAEPTAAIIKQAINLYKSFTLNLLRANTGSREIYGVPTGYHVWKAVFSAMQPDLRSSLDRSLIDAFSVKTSFTTFEGSDFRAALVAIPLSFQLTNLNLIDETKTKVRKAGSQLNKAESFIRAGDLIKARYFVTDAIVLSANSYLLDISAKAQLQMAYLDSILGNHHDALTLAYFGISQAKVAFSQGIIDKQFMAECYRIHGEVYRHSHNYSVAWGSYSSSLSLISNDHNKSQLVHLLSEMAICSSQSSLEYEPVSWKCFEGITEASSPLDLLVYALDLAEADTDLENFLPMLYFRLGIISSFSTGDNSSFISDKLKQSLEISQDLGNEKAALFAATSLVNDELASLLKFAGNTNLDRFDEFKEDFELNQLLFSVSELCDDPALKVEQYPSLIAQFKVGLEILRLFLGQKDDSNELVGEVTDTFAGQIPIIFGSPLSTVGTDARPLGYNIWISALISIEVATLDAVLSRVRDVWIQSENDIPYSAWLFLIHIKLAYMNKG